MLDRRTLLLGAGGLLIVHNIGGGARGGWPRRLADHGPLSLEPGLDGIGARP